MENSFSKIVLIIMIAFLTYVLPTMYILVLTSVMKADLARDETKMLIDSVICKGYMSKSMYDVYKKSLHLSEDNIHFYIKRSTPIMANGEIIYKDFLFTEYTLFRNLEDKEIVKFEHGDMLLIQIDTSYNDQLNTIFKRIFGIEIDSENIRYGGIIKNEIF